MLAYRRVPKRLVAELLKVRKARSLQAGNACVLQSFELGSEFLSGAVEPALVHRAAPCHCRRRFAVLPSELLLPVLRVVNLRRFLRLLLTPNDAPFFLLELL